MPFRPMIEISGILVWLLSVSALGGADRDSLGRRPAEFRVDSELVVLPISIMDRKGRTMLGLHAEDFMVAEDGVPQKIVALSSWDAPASIGVIFDASGSMRV